MNPHHPQPDGRRAVKIYPDQVIPPNVWVRIEGTDVEIYLPTDKNISLRVRKVAEAEECGKVIGHVEGIGAACCQREPGHDGYCLSRTAWVEGQP